MMSVLSREPESSMFGFSIDVAKLVTQPFCFMGKLASSL